jgi:predicted HTH transcriptional regulator
MAPTYGARRGRMSERAKDIIRRILNNAAEEIADVIEREKKKAVCDVIGQVEETMRHLLAPEKAKKRALKKAEVKVFAKEPGDVHNTLLKHVIKSKGRSTRELSERAGWSTRWTRTILADLQGMELVKKVGRGGEGTIYKKV